MTNVDLVVYFESVENLDIERVSVTKHSVEVKLQFFQAISIGGLKKIHEDTGRDFVVHDNTILFNRKNN